MAVSTTRSDNAVRDRSRRVYSPADTRPSDNPLDTLLRLVALTDALRAHHEHARPSRSDLKEVIYMLYRVATGNFERAQVLSFAARRARSMAGGSGAVIALKQADDYFAVATEGDRAPVLGARFSVESGISGECVRTASILRCDDTENDSLVNAEATRALGIRSLVAVPIFGRGEVVGLLEVLSSRAGAYDEEQTYLLQLISALVSHALASEVSARPAADRARQDVSAPSSANQQVAIAVQEPVPTIPALKKLIAVAGVRRFGIGLRIAAGLLVSATVFVGFWMSIPHSDTGAVQNRQPFANSVTKLAGQTSAGTPASQTDAGPAEISGIKFKSHGNFTAVKINLSRWIKQQSGRLHDPNRIYFDLFDSELGGNFLGKRTATINVDDPYVERIRMAQDPKHRTRVVLDLRCACEYSAVFPDRAPYELSILVQPPQHMARGTLLRAREPAGASGQAQAASP